MTSRDSWPYLAHISDAIADIASYTAQGRAAFLASKMMRDAVVRNIEIIGEATKRLPQDLKNREPGIPWKSIAGMRDVVVHDYFEIDDEIVWNVVEKELPRLREAIERLMAQATPSDGGQ